LNEVLYRDRDAGIHVRYIDELTWKVSDLIMATKHPAGPNAINSYSEEEKIIHDLDLFNLANEPAMLEAGKENEMELSTIYTLEQIDVGRKKFFTAMLETPRFYLSDHFSPFEPAARRNIRKFILEEPVE
jgi:predicted metal-dependent HD superfamily phosphohydrolase